MKNSILLIILSMAVTIVAAQDAISPFVGSTHTYQIQNHDGNSYEWQVYSELNPLTLASSASFSFLTTNTLSTVQVQWNTAGTYYLMVQETDQGGCSNLKAIRLEVLPGNLQLAFSTSTSTQCYQPANNEFAVGLQFADQNGDSLSQDHFPVELTYQIDGVTQPTQSITYSSQQLQISDSAFAVDSTQNSSVTMILLSATDANGLTIQALVGRDIHSHTVLAEPQISFDQKTDTVYQNTQLAFSVNGNADWSYNWRLTDPSGTETSLNSTGTQSDEILFNQLGNYQLQVQATNDQACLSSRANKTIVVIKNPVVTPLAKPLAIQDINMTWKNNTVSGNVFTNDLLFNGKKSSIKVVQLPLASAGELTFFDTKTGDYTFKPAADYSGEAIFEYQLCTTDSLGTIACSDTASVTIQILDPDHPDQAPVANDDVVITLPNQSVSENFLQNDFDAGNGMMSISRVVTTDLPGTLEWNSDGTYSYTPVAGFSGNVHFNYQVCAQSGNCDWATVSIYILSPEITGDNLFAIDDAFYTEGVINGLLSENDRAKGTVTYLADPLKAPVKGTVSIQPDGQFVYIPSEDSYGTFTDQFIYEVCNSDSVCSQATAYIVANVTGPFIAVKDTFETGACSSVQLSASANGFGNLSFQWQPADFLDDPTSANPTFMPGESTKYTLTVMDGNGNSTSRDVAVVVHDAPQVVTNNQVFVNNSTDLIMLDASESTGDNLQFNWYTDDQGMIASGINTATPEVSGLGKYYVRITDKYGCAALDSVTVGLLVQVTAVDDTAGILINTFADINVLANDIPKDQLDPHSISVVSPPDHGVAVVTSDSIITYTPNQYYLGQDNFVYAVCDYYNKCDEATVLVMIHDESLFVPNAFSPNGDGKNDYFEIQGLSQYEQVSLEVFNRWGNRVYKSTNYGEGSGRAGFWNGVANKGVRVGNGEVPSGTYYYILDLGRGEQKITGFVYINR